MKILSAAQIREADQYTIDKRGIDSSELMEHAAESFCKWFTKNFKPDREIAVFCGPGNNGGDGLAISRMLFKSGYAVQAYVIRQSSHYSKDFEINQDRLIKLNDKLLNNISSSDDLPKLKGKLIIDALFGSGLNRKLEGLAATVIEHLNSSNSIRIAVDMPSGMLADSPSFGPMLNADFTLSFQSPKLSFMLVDHGEKVGRGVSINIGLDLDFIDEVECENYYITKSLIRRLLKGRSKFSHKGDYGHALLVGGRKGKIGAMCLAAKAALRSGCGLCSVILPECGYQILQSVVPEAMCYTLGNDWISTNGYHDINEFSAVGMGPGLGTEKETQDALRLSLEGVKVPLVLDADALNLIAQNPDMWELIPRGSVITPHPGEFRRLFGPSENAFERLERQRLAAIEKGIYVILKGAHTSICTPEGRAYFNLTGTPAMATAGAGDILTGMLTALIARKYSPIEACLVGVYMHGRAGMLAEERVGTEGLIASDIIEDIGIAFHRFI